MMTAAWVPMMLPSALPAVARRVHDRDGVLAAPLFADALIVAGCAYELSAVKLEYRRRCRERIRSGVRFRLACVGSSAGLMLILAGAGLMSAAWMAAIAIVVLAQKLVPPHRLVDVPLAVALVALALI